MVELGQQAATTSPAALADGAGADRRRRGRGRARSRRRDTDRGRQGAAARIGSRRRWQPGSASSARTTCRRPRVAGPSLRPRWPGVELHLIGGLQTNKAADAVALFDAIQTLDRPKLARELAQEMERQARRPRLLVQVNTGEEPQKSGIVPSELDAFVAALPRRAGARRSPA